MRSPGIRCGYCPDAPVAWIEWPCIGRQKGALVCEAHLYDMNERGTGNDLTVKWYI